MVAPEPMAPPTPTPAPPPPPTGSIDGIPQTTGFIAEITGALADLGDDVNTKDHPMAAGAIWRPGGRDVHLLPRTRAMMAARSRSRPCVTTTARHHRHFRHVDGWDGHGEVHRSARRNERCEFRGHCGDHECCHRCRRRTCRRPACSRRCSWRQSRGAEERDAWGVRGRAERGRSRRLHGNADRFPRSRPANIG